VTDELTIPRGITRHEYDRARGWLVRVQRTVDGRQKCARRLFSDGVHGGELGALDAAVLWQREQQEGYPPRERKRLAGYGYVQRGVRRYRAASGELRSYEAFVAWFWDDAGRPSSTSWSIPEHGAEEAEARCLAWLENERAELGAAEPLAQAG
jgi:hypothetical protein